MVQNMHFAFVVVTVSSMSILGFYGLETNNAKGFDQYNIVRKTEK